MGRYNPTNGLTSLATVHSVLIDFGSPAVWTRWTNEPSPNGSRINAGIYSLLGTVERLEAETNPCVQVLSYNDGGTFYGTNSLHWLSSGLASYFYNRST